MDNTTLEIIDNFPTIEITEEQAIDKLHETGWLQEHDKQMTERPQITVFAENASKEEIEDFKQELENVLEKTQGEWITVSERLPDKNMACLVSVGKFNFTEIAMYSDLMGTINHKIFWQGDYGKNNFENITEYVNAWQPLPEPYKEVKKNGTNNT